MLLHLYVFKLYAAMRTKSKNSWAKKDHLPLEESLRAFKFSAACGAWFAVH